MGQDAHEPQLREGIDIPFGPPLEEYLYRCGVCGEEMLVHEAIIRQTVSGSITILASKRRCTAGDKSCGQV